jgi:hypothetical protein
MDEIRGNPSMAPELPQYWHFSRLPGSLTQAQSGLFFQSRVRVRGASRTSENEAPVLPQITNFIEFACEHADRVDNLTLRAKEIVRGSKITSSPDAAKNAAMSVT